MTPTLKRFDLIHYGHDETSFRFEKILPIKDQGWIKPFGGLWTSPADAGWGWRQWCEAEGFQTELLLKSIRLQFLGLTLTINSKEDLACLPWYNLLPVGSIGHDSPHANAIQFESLLHASGIQAIHLTEQGQNETRFSLPYSLYGWDCETVLILDPAGLSTVNALTLPQSSTAQPMTNRRRSINRQTS